MNGDTKRLYPPQQERDSRIDFARGLALLIIFVDHNAFLDQQAFHWLTTFTLGRYSFIDAADVFFFISGYVSGLTYTNALSKEGMATCVRKAVLRCAQLYVAEIVLFLLCSTLILSAPLLDTNAPWSAFHRLRDLPAETLQATLTLTNPPPFFGLLPIYIIFIGLTPPAVWLYRRRPFILGAISVSMYVVVQSVSGLHHYTYADGFNPFAWQVVFIGGLILGAGKIADPRRKWDVSTIPVAVAVCGIIIIAFLRLAPSVKLGLFFHTHKLASFVPETIPFTGKPTVEPLRLVNLLLWVIVIASISPAYRFFRNGLARLVIACGRNSLAVFCMSVFLNYVVLIYGRAASGGRELQLAWNVIGCLLLVVTANCWMFLKQRVPVSLHLLGNRTVFAPQFKKNFHQFVVVIYAAWQAIQVYFSSKIDT